MILSLFLHLAYNLVIQSELRLPELPVFSAVDGMELQPDVRISWGAVRSEGLLDGKQLGPYLWATSESLWFQVSGVARFQVSHGNTILIEPAPGIDEDSVRVFLLGSALGALLFQRGYLVLHGNAIQIGDQCMVCLGHSGSGKSTLAAGFLQRGFNVLADDVVPVDGNGHAVPGFPRIKLWQDVAKLMDIDTAGLRRIRPGMEKFNYPVEQPANMKPLPIRWVYILGREHEGDIQVEPIKGLGRFGPLRSNTYRVRFLEGMALKAEHLKLCGRLAGEIHLARVQRPEGRFTLDGLIDRLLADIAENP